MLCPFTNTLPKFKLVELSESCDAALAAEPFSFTFDEDPACDVIAVRVPEEVPDVEPVNAT